MKKIYLFSLLFLTFCSNVEEKSLNPVTVKQFKEFISATGYETDAERYGWSIVQLNVYDYKIVDGATWLRPDGVSLPTYEQYWKLVSSDERLIVSDNKYPISPVEEVNIIGNVWDITEPIKSDQVRLAGGSLFCSIDTCHGTQEDRELYVDKETGNIHIGFSVLSE